MLPSIVSDRLLDDVDISFVLSEVFIGTEHDVAYANFLLMTHDSGFYPILANRPLL